MEESELVLEEVGMPNSGSTLAAALVSQANGFVTIFRTLPSNAMGEAATRRGEKAERGLEGGARVFAVAAGVDG